LEIDQRQFVKCYQCLTTRARAYCSERIAQQAQQKQKKMPKISQPRSSAPKPPKVAKPSNFVSKPQLKQFEKAGLAEADRYLKLVTPNDRFALLTLF
jgi:hypothetical protein